MQIVRIKQKQQQQQHKQKQRMNTHLAHHSKTTFIDCANEKKSGAAVAQERFRGAQRLNTLTTETDIKLKAKGNGVK